MKINPEIFRAYDIRGIVNKDLNSEIAELIGRAFGTYLLIRGTKDVLVGRDIRPASEEYKEAIVKGLISVGCNVADIGITLSPILFFARKYYGIDGGVMITASHNPIEWNGFKFCHGYNTIADKEIQKIKDILISRKFKSGKGRIKKLKITKAFFKEIKQRVRIKKPLRVVVDAVNATPSLFIPGLLKVLGCKVIPLRCKINTAFPDGFLDPAKLDHYKKLIIKIKDEKADLGILIDGDGDRIGFADEKGNIWQGDTILLLLVKDIVPRNHGRKVIVEIKNSETVFEEVKRLGGVPIFWKTGHALLDDKVFKEKAILCGEMSCHYWVSENWYYFDDAIYALAKVLEIISNSGEKLSEIIAKFPRYEGTPEYRLACPEKKKFKLIKELVDYFRPRCHKVIDIDGIRGYIEDGWFLLRASNTQPLIVVRCEAKSKNGLEKIKKLIKNKLEEYPYIKLDWNKQD